MFSTIKSAACEIGDKAIALQGRNVTSDVAEIWLDLLNSFMREAECACNMTVPTLDEYMASAYVSCGLGPIVLHTLYLICPKLPYERESEQGKLNVVSLHMIHPIGGQTKDAVIGKLWHDIKTNRRELLRLVLRRKDNNVVSKVCEDVFWSMTRGLHFFYLKDDGYTSKEMDKTVETIFFPQNLLSHFSLEGVSDFSDAAPNMPPELMQNMAVDPRRGGVENFE